MADTEKITINMNAVELGKIDLLVEQGHYSNRTDFIRSAIRSQLEKHAVEVQQSVARHSYAIGAMGYDRAELEIALHDVADELCLSCVDHQLAILHIVAIADHKA